MNCQCDHPARYLISRDGKPCYTCALGRCRFYALAPVQCEGYTRVTLGAPGCPLADIGVVLRFEALVHPTDKNAGCFMIRVQGEVSRWEALRLAVLQDPQFEGMWYTAGRAFLYPMAQYTRLIAAVKARSLPQMALEEIPNFYFRCVERMRQLPRQYADDVAAGRARLPDNEDLVYRCLKPFQRDGVRFVLEHHGRAMIADDMGLGKTVQAIAVAHHYRDEWPVLVVCPMSLMENWAKEFNKFCSIPFARIAILQGAKATATSLQDVAIVSYSSLKCVEHAHFNVVILDESHYIKAGSAKRAQQSLKLCRESRRVILLSGTPAMSRPIELYAQLQAVQPSIVPSKSQFGARYCNSFVGRFGIDLTGHAHPDELHSLLRHYLIRRTKRELGNELPSKSRQLLYIYITDKEKKALEKQIVALRRSLGSASTAATTSAFATADSGGSAGSDWASRAPNVFELKMATARAKIPAVQDYVSGTVEQHLDSGEKLILFAHHQCMMEALRSAVEAVRPRQPIDYIYISGDTPPAQREAAAEHFRTEATCTVAILSMQSSGTGHNFTCASTVVFTELDWNPSTHLQCEDRVHRIGQAQPCHIKYLLAEGTSDSVIWPLLQTKLSVTTAMFEAPNAIGAEVHLHDGADKQNVARRDVAAAASLSTPSTSQQSTLDQFMQLQLQPSQAASSGEENDGVVVSMQASPRVSTHSPPSAGQVGLASLERETPPLLLTPTSPSQQQQLSLSPTSTPRPTSRGGYNGNGVTDAAATATTAAAAPPPLISFSEMGNDFMGASALNLSSSSASRRSRLSADSSAGTVHLAARPSSLSTMAPSAVQNNSHPASVLDLMRQTSSPKPSATSVAAGQTPLVRAPVASLDLGLTETASTPSAVMQPSPPAFSRTSPAQSLALSSIVTLPVIDVAPAAAVVAPPRRTVFTFSKTNPTASTDIAAASTAMSRSPASHLVPPAPPPALPEAPKTTAVHVPLRPNLHLKRPRTDAERGSGGSINRRMNASDGDPHGYLDTAAPRAEMGCPAGPAAATDSTELATRIPSASPAAAATLAPPTSQPVRAHPVTLHPIILAAPSPVASAPRRTLFKLVLNASGAPSSHLPAKLQ
ncbi:hypothetical protein GH5_04811 [Leishmania sp. Ghana 2012 LV757]|uniref:hypothetical protein n=1 Tax=Leishmania sp. Ghana 2012 LV757 TaxID=2803181 RepID=UPI001B614991|nr:hypothetical protein GH5_04811 [Leishmania sp. Ghana 2012 LV757]